MNRHPFDIEPIEPRLFLDATAALSSRGVLVVTGTSANETIEIKLNDDTTKVQALLGGTLLGEADVDDVRALSVSAGAGDDTVTVDASVTKRTVVRGGSGNDTLTGSPFDNTLIGNDNRNARVA